MRKDQARNLVKKTLEKPFDKVQFGILVKNLLNKMDEEKSFVYKGNTIPKDFQFFVKTFERIGKYKDPEDKIIDILIVKLQKETSLERARAAQRRLISKYLNGSRGGVLKDGALVAFVSPDGEDWRFSFVKIDYRFDEQGKIKDKLPPARRYSFLVGKNESSHTAQSALVPRLQNDDQNPSLKDLEDAFSVEKVTKEFFEKYRALFHKLKEAMDEIIEKDKKIKAEFESKGIKSSDFSKKLLGQIVFLYFLQKKGWFGVKRGAEWGTGSKHFLRELFNRRNQRATGAFPPDKVTEPSPPDKGGQGGFPPKNTAGQGGFPSKNTAGQGDFPSDRFFNDILEPLFYEALAAERADDYYSRFDCRIPFLNGGLFEPLRGYDWVNTDIFLPDSLFSNKNQTKEGDSGDGILDVFDRYNFTVNEDEPLEKEVAVDPEMLGKVFENLLEVKDRKSKGTYYTPREIVHYMCQESLINYLAEGLKGKVEKEEIEEFIKISDSSVEHDKIHLEKTAGNTKYKGRYAKSKLPDKIRENAGLTDEKLAEIRVCDPAVGSGAFPVGMMNEIVRARTKLNSHIETKDSLSDKKGSAGEVGSRTPYHFKRHAIERCLYGADIDSGAVEIAKLRLWLSLIVDEEEREKVQPLPNLDYKMVCGNSLLENIFYDPDNQKALQPERQKIVSELKRKKDKFTNATSPNFKIKLQKEIKNLTKNLYEYDINRAIKHLEEDIQSGRFSQIELLKDKQSRQRDEKSLKKHQSKIQKLKEMKNRDCFEWRIDFSEIFQKKGGFDIVIANPPYVKEYINKSVFDGLRESPYYQGKMDLWYFFACKGIDISKPDSGIIAFIAQNNWVTGFGASKMRNKVIEDSQILNLIDFGDFKVFEAGIQTMIMLFKRNKNLKNYRFDFRRLKGKKLETKDMISILKKETHAERKSQNMERLSPKIHRQKFFNKNLTFSNLEIENIINKILSHSVLPLQKEEIAQGIVCPQDFLNKKGQKNLLFQLTDKEVANGIHPHHDYVSKKHVKILGDSHKVGDGIFVLSDQEKNALNLTKKELSLIKPYYTTKELFRYSGNPENKEWIIYTDSRFKNPRMMKDYPNIKKHLDQFKKIITSDNKPYGLHRARKESFFKGEKITVARKCTVPAFSYIDFESYVSAAFYVIKTERLNMKFLTGVLNSKLIAFWLRHKGKMQGSNYQIDKEPLLAVPLVRPSESAQQPVIEIVDKILSVIRSSASDYLQNPAKQAQV